MKDLISIIIPVYNVEKFVDKCIVSCINQTYKNIEIILVNDGSIDSSGEICENYKRIDNRITVYHKENGGLSSARNFGIIKSNGKYITFLDSDDWLELNTLEVAHEIISKYSADIVFWSFIKEFYRNNIKYKVFPTDNDIEIFANDKLYNIRRRTVGLLNEELRFPTKTDSFISAWGKLYKSDLIKQNNIKFLDTHLVGSEDVFFNIQAFHFSNKIIYINQFLNHYRMTNESSLTKHHKNTLFYRFKNLYHTIDDFIIKNNFENSYKIALSNRLVLSLINNCLAISSKNYTVKCKQKLSDLTLILNDDLFRENLKKFQFKFLPFKWKIFFIAARFKQSFILLSITKIFRTIN
ncbi:MAG: glycosyltransferase family 2 protein [Thermaurantimonas sp.]|uniref:glycosyltransferase family 2 protein n=1 Tax=Thermaurantimonas sp. TaxID=2681568 RepID=UPI00391BBD53